MYILNNKTIYSITLAQFLYSASRTLAARSSMSRRRVEPSLGCANKRSRDSESGFPNETAQPDHPVIKLTINKPQNTPSTSPSTSSPLVVDFGPHLDSKWTRTASASLVALNLRWLLQMQSTHAPSARRTAAPAAPCVVLGMPRSTCAQGIGQVQLWSLMLGKRATCTDLYHIFFFLLPLLSWYIPVSVKY